MREQPVVGPCRIRAKDYFAGCVSCLSTRTRYVVRLPEARRDLSFCNADKIGQPQGGDLAVDRLPIPRFPVGVHVGLTRRLTRGGRAPTSVSRDSSAAHRRRSEEHTSELQSHSDLVCRLLLEKKKNPPDKP